MWRSQKWLKRQRKVLAPAAHILKIRTIQKRLAWPLHKDDTQIHEVFHILNLMRETVTQVHEAQRVPIKINPKRPTLRHIIIKMPGFKDK